MVRELIPEMVGGGGETVQTRGAVRVFISSTIEDLGVYRQRAEEAVIRAGCTPTLLKYWGPSGRPPLSECLRRIAESDLLVVIVAYRYGWVPDQKPASDHKSITWLEVEQACKKGRKGHKEVLAFLVDGKHPWPEEDKEEFRITRALREGKATPDLLRAVQHDMARLADFRALLSKNFTWESFTTPADLAGKVAVALLERRMGPHPPPVTHGDSLDWVFGLPPNVAWGLRPQLREDLARYLKRELRHGASRFEIRGLKTTAKAPRRQQGRK